MPHVDMLGRPSAYPRAGDLLNTRAWRRKAVRLLLRQLRISPYRWLIPRLQWPTPQALKARLR